MTSRPGCWTKPMQRYEQRISETLETRGFLVYKSVLASFLAKPDSSHSGTDQKQSVCTLSRIHVVTYSV